MNLYQIAASTVAQKVGPGGSIGDRLFRLVIIPLDKDHGAVTLFDGAPQGTLGVNYQQYTIHPGTLSGTDKVLFPLNINLGTVQSNFGAWHITTGPNVRVLAIASVNKAS